MNIVCAAGRHWKPRNIYYPLGDGPCPTCTPRGKMPVRTEALTLTKPIETVLHAELRRELRRKERLKNMPTKKEWLAKATNVAITIDGQPHVAVPKIFSTGSVGYMLSGKAVIPLAGDRDTLDRVQISFSLVVVGSKEWPSGDQ